MPEKDYLRMLEAIDNAELRSLVKEAISEKHSDTPYLVGDTEKRVSMIRNPLVAGRLRGFCGQLISWAVDPDDTKTGNDGHGFALMLTHVLRHIYADEGLEVFQSPAKLDFDRSAGGNTADIIVGRREGRVVRPEFLIESKIGYQDDREHGFNNILGLPVILLQGDEIFGNSRAALRKFAADPNPAEYAAKLARAFGGNLKAYIRQG